MTALAVPQLVRLARLVTGEPRDALRRVLMLICEQLAMDLAFVSVLTPTGVSVLTPTGQRVIRLAVTIGGDFLSAAEGCAEPILEKWCEPVEVDGALIIGDARDQTELMRFAERLGVQMISYARIGLRDAAGRAVGTLFAAGDSVQGHFNERDQSMLVGLSDVVVSLVAALDSPTIPPPRVAPDLTVLADTVGSARSVGELTRPLLDSLHDLTGLASAYLTVIHEAEGRQEIRYSHNFRAGFALPEGLSVPWHDTLCKRALEEGRPCTTDVPQVWADSQAAAALRIQVYVSVPVELSSGQVWGTLCAADNTVVEDVARHLPTMRLFARLIASEVERSAALEVARDRAHHARQEAETDPLTGCSTRRVIGPWLHKHLVDVPEADTVLLVYTDVDGFKAVNDTYGHPAGDALLVEVGHRIRAAARPGDLVARHGGDEFLFAARVPLLTAPALITRLRETLSFGLDWQGDRIEVRTSVGAVLSEGRAAVALIAAADAAMYQDKRGIAVIVDERSTLAG